MRSNLLLIYFFVQLSSGIAQTQNAGITFPDRIAAGKTPLILNGTGLRERYFIDLYVCALYVKTKTSNAEYVISADEPMAFRIVIISGLITSEKMKDAVYEGFYKSTDGKMQPGQKIHDFIKAFDGPIKIGDTFDMVYYNGVLHVLKNGVEKISIPGIDFKSIAVGIWLSDNPVSEDLKNDLLGIN